MTRLKELREKAGMNMKEAAAALGFPYTTYVNYEKGVRDPNTEALLTMANYYGVTINYLLGDDPRNFIIAQEEQRKQLLQDQELAAYLEMLRTRPEMKVLLDTVKGATKEEVEANVKFIEALRKGGQG